MTLVCQAEGEATCTVSCFAYRAGRREYPPKATGGVVSGDGVLWDAGGCVVRAPLRWEGDDN